MKSICNALKVRFAHYLKKDILKEGAKGLDVLTQNIKKLNTDKISISNLELYEKNMFFYKPSNMSNLKEKSNNLFYTPKSNFSNLSKNCYFYSSVTGMDNEIDVTSDYIFKGIFNDEARIIDFLENILIGDNKLFPKETKIQELKYLKNEYIQNKMPQEAKKSIFDLQIKTESGLFIIEIQKNVSQDYLKRIEFYNAIAYSNQDIKGKGQAIINDKITKYPMKDYESAYPIVSISVIEGRLFDNEVPCVSYHTNIEKKTGKQYMKAFSYVFVELDKFDANDYNKSMITENEKDWLTFFKTKDLNKIYKNEQVNSAIRYVHNIRTKNMDDYYRHQITELANLKEKERDEKINIEKGMIIGFEKGFEKGLENKEIEVAKKMLIDKEPLEKIMRYSGLSKEQLNKIKV
jgi:predicted transposase/invertase (TIGR01784 family)